MRFSVRNGTAVREWVENALHVQTGEELARAVALWLLNWEEEVLTAFESRSDQAAARALIEFWPCGIPTNICST